jgi:hypothetical protein
MHAMQCWKKRQQEAAATASRWPEWYFAVEFKTKACSKEDERVSAQLSILIKEQII